ncbi:MAG: hypothetical protein ACI81R_003016 [Bradymonadia bacterium]|jgi:hypothetical protein
MVAGTLKRPWLRISAARARCRPPSIAPPRRLPHAHSSLAVPLDSEVLAHTLSSALVGAWVACRRCRASLSTRTYPSLTRALLAATMLVTATLSGCADSEECAPRLTLPRHDVDLTWVDSAALNGVSVEYATCPGFDTCAVNRFVCAPGSIDSIECTRSPAQFSAVYSEQAFVRVIVAADDRVATTNMVRGTVTPVMFGDPPCEQAAFSASWVRATLGE